MPGRRFGCKRDERRGNWRRPRNDELYDVHSHQMLQSDETMKNRMGGSCDMYGGLASTMDSFGEENYGINTCKS